MIRFLTVQAYVPIPIISIEASVVVEIATCCLLVYKGGIAFPDPFVPDPALVLPM